MVVGERGDERTMLDQASSASVEPLPASPSPSPKNETCPEDSVVKLLAEIVGGYKLGLGFEDKSGNNDRADSDVRPFCLVRLGDRGVHKTKKAEGGRNPVWTVSTLSTFLIEATPRELACEVLEIAVFDSIKDPFNLTVLGTQFLGKARLDLSDVVLNHCNEERMEVDLTNKDGSKSNGSLTLRFRLATASDERFLDLLNRRPELLRQHSTRHLDKPASNTVHDSKKLAPLLITEADETQMAGESFMNAISGAFKSKRKFDRESGQDKVLVKPGPDPARKEETAYLTNQEFLAETEAPSHQWVEAGSGKLGKLYLEVLSCKDLPNVDVGEAVGNVSDVFVCAVFEDAMVQTPVIDDELSPHWLPWTQRAFVFQMMHPASMLYLAAFDYDLGVTDHEALGRAVVNIANLQADTDYVLQYELYPSTNVTDRTGAGSIKIRLRIEFHNEKEALLAALRPRPKFHINVRREKSLSVLRYTCFGEYGDDNEQFFDLTVMRSYVNEILGYKKAISYCFGDAIRSLVFWRGQVQIGKELLVPLHSFLFFCFATTLVEKPYLAPPFFLLSIAWVMLATQTLRLQHPSPWNRCHSFLHYVDVLRKGESSPAVHSIRVDQGAKEAEAYEKEWQDRLEKDEKLAATQAALQEKISKMGDESIHTKFTGGIPLDLIARLTRYQGILARLCKKFRMAKIVLTWEESYLSFWITASFLVGGLVSLLLPWSFICLWVSRILVWGLFGPHMKLLDWHLQAEGKEDELVEKAVENFKQQSRSAIARRQEAVKLRDMKLLSFGEYSSLVPSYNLSRHYDRPLPASSATYHNPKPADIKIAPVRVPGQQFFGIVLPRTEAEASSYEREAAGLQKLQADVEATIKAIKEADNPQLVSKDNSMPEEAGYEVISGDGSTDNKEFCLSDTTSLSHSPGSRVAILRKDMKASATRRRSSTYRGGIELIQVDEDPDDDGIHIGDSLSLHANSSVAISEVQDGSNQTVGKESLATVPQRSLRFLGSREPDEERESGEVEVVLGLPLRDEASVESNSNEERGAEETTEVDDDASILYYQTSFAS